MAPDTLLHPREQLAQSVLRMLTAGLSSALTLFAPRRMGKTEFLVKDLMPLAENNGWRVFYYSFMGDDAGEIAKAFPIALQCQPMAQQNRGQDRRADQAANVADAATP
ncbi:hypothetical protein [Paludibacterium purpuratum]|uniref:AAA domain-containing protein n=1 Tax=Paludibacterium purpuratum TaxID=1144873 RepID=A0A4R7B9X2_9NEIS|nr:hypothetical protein [Paludibacterium purpuratum]TDR81363.1 hypothetical protein DFP86_10316 [Paludibacterium purpuratum]